MTALTQSAVRPMWHRNARRLRWRRAGCLVLATVALLALALDALSGSSPSVTGHGAGPAGQARPAVAGQGRVAAPAGIGDVITDAIVGAFNAVIRSIVTAAIEPLVDMLGKSLLTTPTPSQIPHLAGLWRDSWALAVAAYALLVTVAGLLVMTHQTVQTRYSLKELAPRIPLGFLAAALSLVLAGKAISLANGLSVAVMSGGVEEKKATEALGDYVLGSLGDGKLFLAVLAIVLVVALVALPLTYIVRVVLTLMLVAGAPLALICYATPVTDSVARWWCLCFGGVLAIQVAQSLALVTALRLLLQPGNTEALGFSTSEQGLVTLLMAIALMYILVKIPFWILSASRLSHYRSFAGSLARAYVAYRTFGLLRGAAGRGAGTPLSGRERAAG